jgi:hypothetical protein
MRPAFALPSRQAILKTIEPMLARSGKRVVSLDNAQPTSEKRCGNAGATLKQGAQLGEARLDVTWLASKRKQRRNRGESGAWKVCVLTKRHTGQTDLSHSVSHSKTKMPAFQRAFLTQA